MLIRTERIPRWVIVIGALLLASCGGSEVTAAVEQEVLAPAATSVPTPTAEQELTTQDSPSSIGECEEPAAEIDLGAALISEIVNDDQLPPERLYFCVQIPEGTSSITFELAEMTSDLNLYVGHPDLETVQQGDVWFWSTNERGIEDKVVVVLSGLTDYVNPGPYYIEVSAQDFQASSPFTLSVGTP